MKWILCPVCFERIAVPSIGWRCPSCHAEHFRSEEEIPWREKLGFPSPEKWRHPVDGKRAPAGGPGREAAGAGGAEDWKKAKAEAEGEDEAPEKGKAPKPVRHCGQWMKERICPACRNVLPPGKIGELSDMCIAVIGAKGSGKSHFVAVLVQRLKELGTEFGWSFNAWTTETADRYTSSFYLPLYNGGTTLAGTDKGGLDMGNRPLVYTLEWPRRNARNRLMVVFFDSAGEDLAVGANARLVERYLCRSCGVVCLLDPLQLGGIRETLIRKGVDPEDLPTPVTNTDTRSIVELAWTLIRGAQERGETPKREIPLAVAFSKMDFIRDAGEDAEQVLARLRQPTGHRGFFDDTECGDIDRRMQAWVAKVDPNVLHEVRNSVPNHAFFGFSALGRNPERTESGTDGKKRLGGDGRPHPFRVEDPFLWILAENGFVERKRT